ncbi:hypothetical protein F5Y11DRAFT_337575 [Daldinia sp. FL1419]|nr:hypothetical protein F5Y11DRAFT_337575 [Daldinia sp. FL1419]
MSDTPDLSLPAKAPSMERYHDAPMSLHPAALYTLVDMDDTELADLVRECESGCVDTGNDPGNSVRFAPRSNFVGQPLRAVFDYHLELGLQDTFDPCYFIAAVWKDWKTNGVIMVTLDDDDLECNVDKFRIKAADSGLSIVNLQIGNSSWEEEKECYGLDPDSEDGDDDVDSEDDEDDEGNEDGDKEEKKDDGDDGGDDDDGPPRPKKNVPLGYYIPIYIHSSLSEDKIIADLEPAFQHKSPKDYACRVQAKLTPASTASNIALFRDLIQQAVSLHPLRCAKNPYLHKNHVLVIDTADPDENGMLMVKLPPWDASSLETIEKEDLRRIGEELARNTTQHIRVPYSCYEGLQMRFLILTNGDADWPSEDVRNRPVFVVFQYNKHQKDLGFGASSIDPDAAIRKPGEERLIYAPGAVKHPGEGLDLVGWSFNEAVRRFPWFCREKRFVEGLDTTYFICVDGDDVAEKGVLLVRRKWDGKQWGRTRDELLGLPVDGVKDVRVPIKEALGILEKGKKNEVDEMSKDLREFFS